MSRFCYHGKMIDVWADNDGGLLYWDEDGKTQTVEERKYDSQRIDRTEHDDN